MQFNIRDGLIDDEVPGLMLLRLVRRHLLKLLGHGGKRLVYLVHLRWLQQKARDAEAYRLLRVVEVAVAGEDAYLHLRKLAFQPRKHRQSVLIRHTDIGKDYMRPKLADQRGSGSGIICRAYDAAVILLPLDHLAQTFDYDAFIVYEYDPIHAYHPVQTFYSTCAESARLSP